MRIYLIGFMGCGKSTAGKKLAAQMHYPLLDIDKRIEELEGNTVSVVFSEKGEQYFRETERAILHSSSFYDDAVISCGGGTPCFYDNMHWMKMNGVTVYLKANTNFLFTRLQTRKAKRPLIAHMSDDELKKYIRKKLTEREAIYLQADIIYNAVDVDVALLQMMIINYLRG